MNGTGDGGKAESTSAFVRPIITLGLTATFCYLAIIGKISTDAFMGAFGMALTWWFKSRDEKTAQAIATDLPPGTEKTTQIRQTTVSPAKPVGPTGAPGDPIAMAIDTSETGPVPVKETN